MSSLQRRRAPQIRSQAPSPLVLYGAFAFGACGSWRPCAYYVVFRDPVARIASEFKYCRETVAFEDQCCTGSFGVAYARDELTSVGKWAKHKGNFMLEHFLGFSEPDWRPLEETSKNSSYASWHRRDFESRVNPLETRRRREGPANAADLAVALANLDKWFAVVGLTERYDESMALFSWVLTGRATSAAEAKAVHTHNQGTGAKVHTKSPLPDALLDQVRQALALDIQLYDAAVKLFDFQVKEFKDQGHVFLDRR